MRPSTSLIIMASFASGCAAGVEYRATGSAYSPDLVYAAPGVQVIADYDQPIFYADSYYWRFDHGRWARSSYYTGGWGYASPPTNIMRIDRPQRYVHYRPQGWAGHQRSTPVARDHRGDQRRVDAKRVDAKHHAKDRDHRDDDRR